MSKTIRLGTRGSLLARWQTEFVAGLLRQAVPGLATEVEVIETKGDRNLNQSLTLIGGKGLFTDEIETALRKGKIDLAVHSLKDLPTENSDGLVIGAIPGRANPADVLVSRTGYRLETLPTGARVGTCSHRRTAQLKRKRPDLFNLDIRGNVDSRISKALDPDGLYDAIVLAYAGLERLGRLDVISEELPFEVMLPAPGQAALAVQCRPAPEILSILSKIDHPDTRLAVTAERAFLSSTGGGCIAPVAALAVVFDGKSEFRGRITSLNGQKQVDVHQDLFFPDIETLSFALNAGKNLANEALKKGGFEILKEFCYEK